MYVHVHVPCVHNYVCVFVCCKSVQVDMKKVSHIGEWTKLANSFSAAVLWSPLSSAVVSASPHHAGSL